MMLANSKPRLTVLIPLHRGRQWVDNVSLILERCPSFCRIIVSDVTLCDDALDHLQELHRDDSRILFRKRTTELGWRRHIIELFDLVETEFCSIMPQDDIISAEYYSSLIAALDAQPNIGLAFGKMIAIAPSVQKPPQLLSPPFQTGKTTPWREALSLDQQWNLGIPWRGVVRSEYLWPTPLNPQGFADQMWVFGIALQTHILEVSDAVYHKRYHSENTHSAWEPLERRPRYELMAKIINSKLSRDKKSRRAALGLLKKRFKSRAFGIRFLPKVFNK